MCFVVHSLSFLDYNLEFINMPLNEIYSVITGVESISVGKKSERRFWLRLSVVRVSSISDRENSDEFIINRCSSQIKVSYLLFM